MTSKIHELFQKLQDKVGGTAASIVLAALVEAIRGPIPSAEKKIDELIERPYKSALSFLEDAQSVGHERHREFITKALMEFTSASTSESQPEMAAYARFFVGACYDLMGEERAAMRSYEKSMQLALKYELHQEKYAERSGKLFSGLAGGAIFCAGMTVLIVLFSFLMKWTLPIHPLLFLPDVALILVIAFFVGVPLARAVNRIQDSHMKPVHDFRIEFLTPLSHLLVSRGYEGSLMIAIRKTIQKYG